MKKYFFYFKRTPKIISKIRTYLTENRAHKKLIFFYKKKGQRFFKSKNYLYKNIFPSYLYRRKTFIYEKPFAVNRIFISKLFTIKLIKRLANVW